MSRFTYWTIIIDDGPTAFRAGTREELLPTLRQLQAKNPGARLKWFARGRLWDSPREAYAHLRRPRRQPIPGGEKRKAGHRGTSK